MNKMRVAEIKTLRTTDKDIILTLESDRNYNERDNYRTQVIIPKTEQNDCYSVGTLVKFYEDNNVLEIIPTNNFDYDEFSMLEKRITKMNCEQLIETHKSLIGKTDAKGIHEGEFGEYYFARALDHNFGYSIVKETPLSLSEFFQSKYISDYLKELIKTKIKNPLGLVLNVINSDKSFLDFTGDEFNILYNALQGIRKENGKVDYSYNYILALAFNLDSDGARDFLNNKVDQLTMIKRIVSTSGLVNSPEYYSGRGARECDLNGKMLYAIYTKLSKLDKNKALNMVKMTFEIPTLGATEFLESLYNLVCNNYIFDSSNISTDNFSFGNARGKQMEIIALISLASAFGARYDCTDSIKDEFKELLPLEVIQEVFGVTKKKN